MATTGQPYTSGNWIAKAGEEEAFIAEWTAFAQWSRDNAGAQSVALLRGSRDPRHFISFGSWGSAEAVERWRASDEFRERLSRCRAHCDEFGAHDFELVASAGG